MMSQPGPKVPSPTLSDVGKGRILRGRGAILERFDGTGWRQVGRFGSVHDAGEALDEVIGAGADPASVRVVEIGPTSMTRALTIAGLVLFGLIVAFCVSVLFG
jgi:hypothetical protein